MVVATLLTLGGMAAGGMAGLGAGQQRAQQSRTNFGFAEDYLDATLKSNRSKRSILTGNLTLGAMGANQSAKANAVGAAAETSAQKASLGNTGLASGTPFYKLDQDIRDRSLQVMEAQKASQIQMAMQKDEATAGMAQLGLAEAQARQQLMAAGADLAYTSSPVALALSTATGAFAGGQMANSVMQAGVQSNLLSEDFLGAKLFEPKAGIGTLFDPSSAQKSMNWGPLTPMPSMFDASSAAKSYGHIGAFDPSARKNGVYPSFFGM